MEERKRRIMRKYMRTPAAATESDLLVPTDELPEDEQILDSEKFKEPQVEFQRHEQGTTPMPRPAVPRRPLPQTEDRNWLLSGDEEMDAEDLYADPFGRDDEEEKKTSRDSPAVQRTEPRRYDPYGSWRKQQPVETRGSLYGVQPEEEPASPFSLDYRRGTPAGTAASPADPLKSPFSSATRSSDRYRRQEKKQQGLIPYRSPYQTEQRPRTPYSGFQQQEQEEFRRVDPYQKLRDQRKKWDPTKDDAYLDELMQRDRR